VLLLPPRAELYAACDARFLQMMERGALAEAAALLARGLDPALPAMRAVGVPELAALLAGRASREAAVAAAQQATRRYAKRQYTWFRHQMPEHAALQKLVLEQQFSESLTPEILPFIRRALLTTKT
jgi:tRNA dimethylallyltransferase